jgi:hypothetical protein
MKKAPRLVEGKDYYIENGLYVFTASFLKHRGYCCQSGCRHCPYGYGPAAQGKNAAPPKQDQKK